MILVSPTYLAGEGIAHKTTGIAGLHRTTLIQFAAELARPEMANRGFAPLTALGAEAIAARVIHAERDSRPFAYFEGVAAMPGFARALARTLAELRLARVAPASLAENRRARRGPCATADALRIGVGRPIAGRSIARLRTGGRSRSRIAGSGCLFYFSIRRSIPMRIASFFVASRSKRRPFSPRSRPMSR